MIFKGLCFHILYIENVVFCILKKIIYFKDTKKNCHFQNIYTVMGLRFVKMF